MKKILGLDLGTNSIGWALTSQDFENKKGEINGLGSRIIPMSQDILGKFDSGQSHSQTANRTSYRGVRRLYQRNLLRRERLHRVLNVLNFLPKHYKESIDFEKHFGQFKNNTEVKLNYSKNSEGKHEFIFMDSFNEMVTEFKEARKETKIPLDWTIYYLRKKALTHKITKQELAWVLLNFNQKRGYYQLRGEEEDESQTNKKEYYSLKVKEVIATEDKNARGIWYHVILENDWIYKRQSKESLGNWLGKTKEFIVTTQLEKDGTDKLDKEGNIRRSFSAVDSEKDWIAIKKKTEQDIEQSTKTVGQYIYETLLDNPSQKIRGKLVKTIERKFYKEELQAILKTQIQFHPELKDRELYKVCVNELYPRNEAHQNNIKDNGFNYLFIDDIIFYQRPLKSKKSTISDCPYEERVFIKDGVRNIQKIKCIAKSHPLFQEFRLWQFLKNLKIHQKENVDNGKFDEDITGLIFKTDNDWVLLFDFLNDKKEVEQKHIIDFLVENKKIAKSDKKNYRWNYVEDKKYPANETRASFLSRLKKVKNENRTYFLSKEIEIALWHIIYSVKDKKEYELAIKTFALKNNLDKDTFVDAFIKYPPFKNDYGAYSEKAIKKILPLMRMGKYWDETKISDDVKNRILQIQERLESINYDKEVFKGDKKDRLKTIADDEIPKQFIKSFINYKDKNPLKGLNTYQACYAIYERHSESGIIKPWKSPNDIDTYLNEFKQHSLRNPIVEQVVTETLRVVRDIWKHYGKGETDFFYEIHVELGREMKNSSEKRKAMSSRNIENENTNERIKFLLEELKNDTSDDVRPYSPSHQEILKIYEEGVYQNPEVSFLQVKEDDIDKIRRSSSPTKSEINKYKLWLEQGYISPYTGKIIPLSKLFSIDYQIEHIIPQSRYFDNSMTNKIICESEVNQLKDNKTAYEFLKGEGGRVVSLSDGNTVTLFNIDKYEKHCKQYFKKNRTKLNNLLSEDIPEGFINRQLNDSRYISKIIKTLLSNIVREDGEKEATTKRLVPVTGSITSRLKQDWGLNDKWNEIVAPRFMRLNELTNSKDFGEWDSKINAFRTKVPDEISRGFSKKRIDHRHHALDALIIACCTKKHTNYLGSLNSERENYGLKESLLIKNKQGDFTKHFQLPWVNFSTEAKEDLEKTIISFKQNLRIINKTNNKTWQWEPQSDGTFKKILKKQKDSTNSTNKTNWAIRKPMHKETVSGAVKIKKIKKGFSNITNYLDKSDLIVDKSIKRKVKSLLTLFDNDLKKVRKYLKETPLLIEGKEITKTKVFEWSENATATRVALNEKFTRKQLESITDGGIITILERHLKNYIDDNQKERFDLAFSPDGIDALNKNIKVLNNGKNHYPIYKVRLYEEGSKFSIGESGAKANKFVEAAKGTNLFFAIYYDEEKKKRVFETIPLNEVIAHQKQTASFPKEKRIPIQPSNIKGDFLFTLSPNDLVYVPTDEELENKALVDFNNLSNEQVSRIYKMVSSSNSQCFFIRNDISKPIYNKKEFSVKNKMEKDIEDRMIKDRCWRLNINRIGNINTQI
ncbi:CRISPR-associated protein Csn1 [Polaribacter sp. R2A056_3_33]|uniref:type II CRISPR RNA-guided endonuclease Cas9 n=1 Tax=Polaribacter sp. R2A056_3_33 TaxID=2745563 RepID=UPI001C4EA8F4|nr:type II CRISPR RNA-guided endonuclease Cas9 [Polaribacter sp. R2A056_3_33]QXP70642.1 CRISPR-associated protein Csn1 [Polaribacter sp. R2A056_3_33]